MKKTVSKSYYYKMKANIKFYQKKVAQLNEKIENIANPENVEHLKKLGLEVDSYRVYLLNVLENLEQKIIDLEIRVNEVQVAK